MKQSQDNFERKKIVKSLFLVFLLFFVVSWQYKLVFLAGLVYVWREVFPTQKILKICLGGIFILIFFTMPRFKYNTSDQVRLIYHNNAGKPQHPPLIDYLINVIAPEEEILNAGISAAKMGIWAISSQDNIIKAFKTDQKTGALSNFYRPYTALNIDGNFLMSGTTLQVFKRKNVQNFYLIKPKDFDKNKKYPVVFFMHGYLGNWKLYTGIFKNLKDCIVVCVGTKDLSGHFTKKDFDNIFEVKLQVLDHLGLKYDLNNLHVIGLSNGGTASNVAYNSFSRRFKSITFISTGIHQTYRISSSVYLIGSGKDASSGSLPGAYRKLKQHGVKTKMYWEEDQTHFLIVNKADEIVEFLNEEYGF